MYLDCTDKTQLLVFIALSCILLTTLLEYIISEAFTELQNSKGIARALKY